MSKDSKVDVRVYSVRFTVIMPDYMTDRRYNFVVKVPQQHAHLGMVRLCGAVGRLLTRSLEENGALDYKDLWIEEILTVRADENWVDA